MVSGILSVLGILQVLKKKIREHNAVTCIIQMKKIDNFTSFTYARLSKDTSSWVTTKRWIAEKSRGIKRSGFQRTGEVRHRPLSGLIDDGAILPGDVFYLEERKTQLLH